jgi:ATP-dependent DNA helicase RecG
MNMTLDSPLTELVGVGEALAKKFAVLGISSISDLIDFYPRRYEDYSEVVPIAKLMPGVVTIEATIKQATGRYVRRGMHITEAIASDETGSIRLVWFNQPYRAAALKKGQSYYISGQYELRRQRFTITNPSIEAVSDFPVNTARILATYRETKGLTSRQIRSAVQKTLSVINLLPETLPKEVVTDEKLLSRASAIKAIHLPESPEQLADAKRRIGFEEVFQLSLASLLNKLENQSELALAIPFKQELAKDFVQHLPFELTTDQRKAVWQIYLDMQKTQPMNRLVEGDVGSGKTVVAAMSALMPMEQNWQVALMAPTELLARQHAETLKNMLKPLGYQDQVGLLTGSLSSSQKEEMRRAIKASKSVLLLVRML